MRPGKLLREIKTQQIFEWRSFAERLLKTYIKVLQDPNKSKTSAPKTLLLSVLDDGVKKKIVKAQKQLGESKSKFNDASGRL